jgi:hypothetical protein
MSSMKTFSVDLLFETNQWFIDGSILVETTQDFFDSVYILEVVSRSRRYRQVVLPSFLDTEEVYPASMKLKQSLSNWLLIYDVVILSKDTSDYFEPVVLNVCNWYYSQLLLKKFVENKFLLIKLIMRYVIMKSWSIFMVVIDPYNEFFISKTN